MTRARLEPRATDIPSLLAVERELVPASEAMRKRVIQRAQAALPTCATVRLADRSSRPGRVRVGQVAAAAVLLTALCALAFEAGYRTKNSSLATPPITPTSRPSFTGAPAPVASSASSPPASPETPPIVPSPARKKPSGSPKSAEQAYALELRVLQPAQHSVARQDFTSALAAITEHQRRFPRGRLAEEREALRVRALLGVGRPAEAQRAAARFRAHFPNSALVERIDPMQRTQR